MQGLSSDIFRNERMKYPSSFVQVPSALRPSRRLHHRRAMLRVVSSVYRRMRERGFPLDALADAGIVVTL